MNKEYEIYYDAYDIKDPENRKQFILEKCAGDSTLFENIMRLFPEEPIDDDTYGKYSIQKKIGQGGMGVVYLAAYTETFESESFKRKVALKTISPEHNLDSKNIKKFLHEIKTLAELDHPNIARFLDIGTSERGKPFFIMEYVDGEPLTEYCNKNKLSIEERLRFFRGVLDAIEYSHSRGFIHCDLKPTNILVNSNGEVKVIDFGIASKYGSFISDQQTQTTFLQYAFTLDYASPEQIRGEKNLSETTDIYSLGVVLYELLTGQLPIKLGESQSYPHLVSLLEKNDPLHLKTCVSKIADYAEKEKVFLERDCKSISELKGELTNGLDEVVQKAINKKRSKRYENASAFRLALGDLTGDDSFSRHLKNALESLYRSSVRKFSRIPFKWAAVTLIAMLAFLGISSQSSTVRTIPYYLQIKYSDNSQITLSSSQQKKLDKSIASLKNPVSSFLSEALLETNQNGIAQIYGVWSVSDFTVALTRVEHPLNKEAVNAFFEKQVTQDGCWKEEKFDCKLAITGWVAVAKSNLGKPLSEKQIEFVLLNQSSEGWFPAFPYLDYPQNASTYATSIVILGLAEQLKRNLVGENHRQQVLDAIKKGANWLINTRRHKAEFMWEDCPASITGLRTPSIGLDGTVLYVLHFVANANLVEDREFSETLKELDSKWLDNISKTEAVPLDHNVSSRCDLTSPDGPVIDRTTHFSTYWPILATIEAYKIGTPWQKAQARYWLESLPFDDEYKGPPFGAAEYLMSLGELNERVKNQ